MSSAAETSLTIFCKKRIARDSSAPVGMTKGGARTARLEALLQRHIPGAPLDVGRRLVVAVFRSPATNGGAKSKTLFTPSVIVVLLSHALHPHGLYSAVDTGMTFLSLPLFHRRVLAAILGVASDFVLRSGRWIS